MPTFTANPSTHPFHGSYGCNGVNHSDAGLAGHCDGCGAPVFKADKGQLTEIGRNNNGAGVFQCWRAHHCDPQAAAVRPLAEAEMLVGGRFPKGIEVEVFKGRKVPVGTVGTVRWIGENEFNRGNQRLGLAVEGQTKLVYVDGGNVRVSDEVRAAARTMVEQNQAQGARLDELETELKGLWVGDLVANLPAGTVLSDEQNALFEGMQARRDEVRAEIDQIKTQRGY